MFREEVENTEKRVFSMKLLFEGSDFRTWSNKTNCQLLSHRFSASRQWNSSNRAMSWVRKSQSREGNSQKKNKEVVSSNNIKDHVTCAQYWSLIVFSAQKTHTVSVGPFAPFRKREREENVTPDNLALQVFSKASRCTHVSRHNPFLQPLFGVLRSGDSLIRWTERHLDGCFTHERAQSEFWSPNRNFIDFLLRLSAHFPPFYSPMNDRMRKRRAFADQDLMETTITNYYMQMSPPTSSYPPTSYSSIESLSRQVKPEPETPTRPKLSFSIESIIGLKWKFITLAAASFKNVFCDVW